MKLECSWNTFPLGMQLESFEHEQNIPTAHKNGPESLECGWNEAGSFRTQLEYPGMDKEFSFQLHHVHSSSSVIGVLCPKTFQLHSKRKCIPTAFKLHSNCVLNIRMTFQQHLNQIAHELCSNNVEHGFGAIFVQHSNCIRTAFEVHSKSSSCILTVF